MSKAKDGLCIMLVSLKLYLLFDSEKELLLIKIPNTTKSQ